MDAIDLLAAGFVVPQQVFTKNPRGRRNIVVIGREQLPLEPYPKYGDGIAIGDGFVGREQFQHGFHHPVRPAERQFLGIVLPGLYQAGQGNSQYDIENPHAAQAAAVVKQRKADAIGFGPGVPLYPQSTRRNGPAGEQLDGIAHHAYIDTSTLTVLGG